MFENFHKFFSSKQNPKTDGSLAGVHIAILATDGFEQSELFEPKRALEEEGAIVHVISPRAGRIRGWSKKSWGRSIQVDMTIRQAWSMDFDALVLPGGVLNPDKLRENPEAVAFVRSFRDKRRPIGAICHGVQMLIEADLVNGKRMTSYPSVRTDLINAGADWVDKEVVIDESLVTSRRPSDLPAFNRALIRTFSLGRIQHDMTDKEAYSIHFS